MSFSCMSILSAATAPVETEPDEFEKISETLQVKADTENIFNKIHFYCNDEENSTIDDMDELVKATQKMQTLKLASENSDNSINEMKMTVQFESDFLDSAKYKEFSKERKELSTLDEVRDFRKRLNSYSNEYHNDLFEKSYPQLAFLEYNSIEQVRYSPFVTLNIDSKKISTNKLVSLAEKNNIVSISISNLEERYNVDDTSFYTENQTRDGTSWAEMLKGINATEIVTSRTYTGEGVRVGIFEANGIFDRSNPNIRDVDITIINSIYTIDKHATDVTAVLTGIAPEAKYFFSSSTQTTGLSLFIDNYCDIINCSFGYGNLEYMSDDRLYDYQVVTHFITVVVSAGNVNSQNNSVVTSPGYAYNVITVGGVKKRNTDGTSWEHDPNSCYVTTPTRVKPNIAAVMETTIPILGGTGGTSIAAPQVAGCVALLMEYDPTYMAYPERVLSALMATAQKPYGYAENIGKFNDKVGAGVIDLQKLIDNHPYYSDVNINESGGYVVTQITVHLHVGDNIQAGLAWLANVKTNVSSQPTDVLLTDYDLYIYSPSGGMKISQLGHSNVEMIRGTATETGYYTIKIYQYGSCTNSSGDWISLTYCITD